MPKRADLDGVVERACADLRLSRDERAAARRRAGAGVNIGRALEERGGSGEARHAPAPARPSARAPRRASSSGTDAACARCHARRSGRSGDPLPRRARGGASRRSFERRGAGTPPSARADGGTPPLARSTAGRLTRQRAYGPTRGSRAAQPRARRARDRRGGRRQRASNKRRASARQFASRRVKLSSIRADKRERRGQTPNPPRAAPATGRAAVRAGRADSRASRPRSGQPLGHPREPAGRTPSRAPRITMSQRPDVAPAGTPPAPRRGSRAANTNAILSASRPASDGTQVLEPTAHRATARRRPGRGGAVPQPPPTRGRGPPARPGTDRGPAGATLRTRRRGPHAGDRAGAASQLEDRGAQLLERGERQAPSLLRPTRPSRRGSQAPPATACSNNAVLPTPGSPYTTKTPPRPPRATSSSRSSASSSRCRPSSPTRDPPIRDGVPLVVPPRPQLGCRTKEFPDAVPRSLGHHRDGTAHEGGMA